MQCKRMVVSRQSEQVFEKKMEGSKPVASHEAFSSPLSARLALNLAGMTSVYLHK